MHFRAHETQTLNFLDIRKDLSDPKDSRDILLPHLGERTGFGCKVTNFTEDHDVLKLPLKLYF